MKPFVFIMCVYYLILTAIPCHCDALVVDASGQDTKFVSMADIEHSDEGGELCSPFCSCTSHHSPNIISDNEISLPKINFWVKHKVVYTDKEAVSIPSSLWRPPQV